MQFSVHKYIRILNTWMSAPQLHEMYCLSVPQVALQALGLDADREEIQKMVPESGEIDFSDFLKVTTLKMVSATQLSVRNSL